MMTRLLPMPLMLTLALAMLMAPAQAQVPAAGMAGAYTAVAAGPEAPAWNPANLGLHHQNGVTFVSALGAIGNNSFSLGDYRELNGAHWGDEEKEKILARVEPASIELDGAGEITVASAAVGNWGFATTTYLSSQLAIPSEYARLVLYGNTVGETFDLADADGSAVAFSAIGVSRAFDLDFVAGRLTPRLADWSAGLTAKLLQGWGYAEILDASGGVTTTTDEITGSGFARSLTASHGRGFAFDVGLAGPIGRGWVASLAARDILGNIVWSDCEEQIDSFEISSLTLDEVSDDAVRTSKVTRSRARATVQLPTRYLLGVARMGERWVTAFGLSVASSGRYGASGKVRASAGVEWRTLRFVTLRGGAAVGGIEGVALACGCGLRLGSLRCDLAFQSWQMALDSSKGLGLGLGFGLVL